MEALRPCPFCGGEAHVDSDYSSELDHTFWQVWHDCDANPGPVRHSYGHALSLQISTPWCTSDEAAIELWNRRAERTCRNVCEWSIDTFHFTCSECGAEIDGDDWGDSPVFVGDYHEQLRYCPNCGARVVGCDDA